MRIIGLLIIGLTVLMSCGETGRSQNRAIQEAAAIHEEIMTRHDSIYDALLTKKDRIREKLDTEKPQGEMKTSYEAMIRSIDKSFRILETWEESVVGVPGFEHDHGEGDHHHHHHHDHMKEDILKDMSDKEILELQKALKVRLDEVAKEIRGLLTTIDMYDGDA
jgi:ABC-type nickel/cobalt efflux system permease component RcnA